MKHFELNCKVRKVGNDAVIKAFRTQGLVPCNLYGQGMKNVLFTVSEKDLKNILFTPNSYIIDINLDNGEKYNAVIHELQFHPVKDNCLHVDFLAISDSKPVTISVPLVMDGHPIGVQNGGKFVQITKSLKICALPKDLPDNLKVDVSKLDLEKRIVAGELKYDNIQILSAKTTIICTVKSSRQIAAEIAHEEALEAAAAPTPAAAPAAAAETAAPEGDADASAADADASAAKTSGTK